MKLGRENTRMGRNLQKNEILCTKWMESCPQLSPQVDYRPLVFARF